MPRLTPRPLSLADARERGASLHLSEVLYGFLSPPIGREVAPQSRSEAGRLRSQ